MAGSSLVGAGLYAISHSLPWFIAGRGAFILVGVAIYALPKGVVKTKQDKFSIRQIYAGVKDSGIEIIAEDVNLALLLSIFQTIL